MLSPIMITCGCCITGCCVIVASQTGPAVSFSTSGAMVDICMSDMLSGGAAA